MFTKNKNLHNPFLKVNKVRVVDASRKLKKKIDLITEKIVRESPQIFKNPRVNIKISRNQFTKIEDTNT